MSNQPGVVVETASALRWLRAAMWLAVIVPAVIFTASAAYLYQETIRQATSHVERAALVAQEHAQKILETNLALVNRVLDAIGDESDAALLARELALHEKLVRMTADLSQLQGVFIMSGQGRLLATDRVFPAPHDIDYTDRELFRHHRDGGAQPLITDVRTSRATGELFFDVSLRRSRADGSFNGAVSTSLRPEYFHRFYGELLKDRGMIGVALVRDDGAVLASWPEPPASSDRPDGGTRWAIPAQAGISRGEVPGSSDGIRVVHEVGRYPIKVVAWEPLRAALAPWYQQLWLRAALLIPLVLALVVVTQVAQRKTRRSLVAFDQLKDEVARRQKVEGILRQAQKLEAMGRLTGGVAHDFNNLLMIVQTNLHILRRRHPDALAGSAELAAMDRAMKSGTKLTRQLLSFSRSQPFRNETVDLRDVLPDMLDMVRTAIGSRIDVRCDVAPATACVEVDVAELELALLNVSLNARDAMPSGGRLVVTARNASANELAALQGSFVVIDVTDTGTGIPADIIDRVFEPFFTTKPVGEGTGLGLSQVYGFCVRSGGTARVESRVGEGTTVRIYLPAAAVPGIKESGSPAVAPQRFDGLRVLLVEDNADVADATADVLEAAGCRITRATSGEVAWPMLEGNANAFDVVLSDIVMPGGLTGLDLALRIRRALPDLPVVLMSGYSKQAADAVALGLPVLAKPATADVLVATLANVVRPLAQRVSPAS